MIIKNYLKIYVILCIIIFCYCSTVSAETDKVTAVDNTTYIDANDILMFVTNRGIFARDLSGLFGYDYGTFYPYLAISEIENGFMDNSPLFAAGIWLGGKVGGVTKVSAAEFSTEFWPGPMVSNSHIADADTVSAYRVYKLFADSMAGNPGKDYNEWPDSNGAPVDGSNNPLLIGEQTLWSVFNDANPASHYSAFGASDPMGIEIQQTTYAYDSGNKTRIVYIKFKLYNKGANNITDFHFGLWLDPDLGQMGDDLTGCDTNSNIIFCYNSNNSDAQYGTAPPAVGAKLVYGPLVASPGSTAVFDQSIIADYKNLNMTSFVSYVNGTDPDNVTESYNYLTGLQKNGDPLANGTKFSYPGDPTKGTGDLHTNPGNHHMVGSFGPIDFNPGDSQFVFVKIGVGQGPDRLTSITNLKTILNAPDTIWMDVDENITGIIPKDYSLSQNYPNPFNPSTTIEFSLPKYSSVKIDVYNILGRKIYSLLDKELASGNHSIQWDGINSDEKSVASGIYFYRIEAGDFSETKKMTLLK